MDARAGKIYAVERKNRELAIQAALAMHEQRAEDIVILDLRALADYADFFVIASASSLGRMKGISRRVEVVLREHGAKRLNQPDREAAWVLGDFGDIVLHLFEKEAREFYRLEDLWGDAPHVEWRDRLPAGEAGQKGAPTPERTDHSS